MKKVNPFSLPFRDLVHLIFPNKCLVCKKELTTNEQHLCFFCQENLTLTHFHQFQDPSPMDKLFWGRVSIHSSYAHLFFEKNKTSQHVLFNLKYKNNPELGEYFGEQIGKCLRTTPSFSTAEVIVPVPLHHKKKFIRGYNQSELLANGISTIMDIPVRTHLVKRNKHSETQTKKSRFQRWDNVEDIFTIHTDITKVKHLILVDDVITTGSTVESICRSLHAKHPQLLISVVTLAIA